MTETEQMTIQDGLSELKLIQQKMNRNNAKLQMWSSKKKGNPDVVAEQRDKVKALMQSNKDHIKRYVKIKLAIHRANLTNSFEWDGVEYTLAEALIHKQGLFDIIEEYLNSINDRVAQQQIRDARNDFRELLTPEKFQQYDLVAQLFYSPELKEKQLDGLVELKANINRLIDKTNHQVFLDLD